ncbi:DNA/RNA non-specific endonuclease [Anaerocolumna aminovalerica]|uniref:DNA/RNA non-specific endonuclease n=1 Tax=Anaerocolumna aminovalerica TaxID=1527 RepID=UPI000BE3657E|nr:hypothetical protein [Anaerocolumna aminovalerica]
MKVLKIKSTLIIALIICSVFLSSCSNSESKVPEGLVNTIAPTEISKELPEEELTKEEIPEKDISEDLSETVLPEIDLNTMDENESDETQDTVKINSNAETMEFNGVSYNIIQVDGGDLSGDRKANVAVDIGFGDREYWAFTNEYGQLVYVYAVKITPQDDESEPVNSSGRYYSDEAKVPGTEHKDLDEGHVIADSLGGVSNAYNITPQDSTLNRHGDQAYIEKVIRDAGGCEEFFATITYPDTSTQIPSHYHYEYILNGEKVVDDFDNLNPDEVNNAIIKQESESVVSKGDNSNGDNDLSVVDKNGNGKVTIAEAKAAGYKMPIYSDHWLYPYMDDRDGDGMVGE